jgi:hypothetical protein
MLGGSVAVDIAMSGTNEGWLVPGPQARDSLTCCLDSRGSSCRNQRLDYGPK